MKKHILLAVAVVLLCVLAVGIVSADETTTSVETFDALKTALATGGTVILANDITGTYTDDTDRIYIDKVTSTLDLNGKTLTVTRSSGTGNKGFIKINGTQNNLGSLTVTDSTGSGEIILNKGESEGATLFFVSNYGKITIDNKDITLTAPQSVIGGNGNGAHTPPIIEINGGTLTSTEGAAIFLPAKDTQMTMTGGAVNGKSGLEIVSGTYTISGGTITGNGEYSENVAAPSSGSLEDGSGIVLRTTDSYSGNIALTISGAAEIASEKGVAIRNYVRDSDLSSKTFSVVIKESAKIEGTAAAIANQKYTGETQAFTKSTFTLNGGTFIVHTFDDLKAYLKAGVNVKLAEGITGTYTDDTDRIYIDKVTSTLDLNGKTLTVTRSSGTGNKGFIKINGTQSNLGSLTVTDSTGSGKIILNKGGSEGATLFFVSNYGKITIDNKDITLTAPQSVIGGNGNGAHTPPTIEINGGTLTSTEGAAIFLPAKDTQMTMTGGAVNGKSGLEIVSGTYTISGGTITGNGEYSENVAAPSSGSLEDGSGIVLRTTDSYSGNIALTIFGTAEIASEKGVAIRNYVRDSDLSSKTFSVVIKESAKIEGTAAAIANQKYTGETQAFTKSTFTLSGGNYLAPSYAKLLVGEPKVQYAENHAMSDTPVKNGYYAPITVQKQETPASCDPTSKVVTVSDGTAVPSTTNPKEVTVTPTGSDKVILTLTYENVPTVSDDGKIVTPQDPADLSNVKAVYNEITVPETSGAVLAKLTLVVTSGTELLESDNLPTISIDINEDAKTKLQGTATLISMVTVDITKIKSKNPVLTLTFKVPKSWFDGKDLSAVRAYHFDGTNMRDKGAPQRTEDATYYIFTITATEASPWGLGLKNAAPPTTTPTYQPVASSGDGNMNNAFRVLFETSGGSFISPSTDLSYGDKISQPPAPTKDGYTFGGWYTDSACTQGWSFASGINGDMTLYAKWTAASGSTTTTIAKPTTQTTTKPNSAPVSTQSQTASATTAAPITTTAAGVTPTLTQAPAPVAGLLFGLLAAGILIRRRD